MKSICIGLFACAIGCALALQFPAAEAQTKEKVLHSFDVPTGDGGNPYNASVINVEGTLYGTTFDGGTYHFGTVFALDRKTGAEKVLHSFCSRKKCTDGEYPEAGLIDVNGTLYGTTNAGGTHGDGTAFGLDPNTGAETVLYSFCSQQNCADGAGPEAGLIDVKGTLYGTTAAGGGASAGGTVFALDPSTGAETVLYSFCSQQNCTDGVYPLARLIDVIGTLYSTTAYGCAYRDGTVFALDRKTGAEKVLYSFCSQPNCTDGAKPYTSVIDVNGTLYGTTFDGGTYGYGTVFALDPNTGAETVLYSFCSQQHCTDGAYPESGLVDVNGTLYGTTNVGGSHTSCDVDVGCGVAFALDPNTGAETVLHSFRNSSDGGYPTGSLIDVRGTLYGTTYAGGIGWGTVFALKNP